MVAAGRGLALRVPGPLAAYMFASRQRKRNNARTIVGRGMNTQRVMPTESQEGRPLAAPLAHRVGAAADAAQVAGAIFAIWAEIDDALTPILGPRGVAALYKRSLHLAAKAHPWLAAPDEGEPPAIGPAALKSALARRSSSAAAAGGSAFLQTFHELLTSLVGVSLTERLLRAAWAAPSSSSPTQDTTS